MKIVYGVLLVVLSEFLLSEVFADVTCNFESDTICGYTDDPGADVEWLRNFGPNNNRVDGLETGPTYDNTAVELGLAPFYMVMTDIPVSQELEPGNTARLISPCYSLTSTNLEMSFYYHMYGADMGTLNVYVVGCDVTSFSGPAFTKSGDQGDAWIQGTIDYDVSGIGGDIKIVFEATRGASVTSVIAIDDILIVVDEDRCLDVTCENGGTCFEDIATWACTCVDGYEGMTCETNIDECATVPCLNNGVCVDGVNEYVCDCSGGYGGTNCDLDLDDCAIAPCQNGGNCADAINGYTCVCTSGFSGGDCETNINECGSAPCENGGECNDEVNRFSCTCLEGYDGTICQTNIDECSSNPCQNNGECSDDVNMFVCTCPEGFSGSVCEMGEKNRSLPRIQPNHPNWLTILTLTPLLICFFTFFSPPLFRFNGFPLPI